MYHTKRETKERDSQQLRTRDVVHMDPIQGRSCNGDMRLKKLQWWLNNLGVQRSPDQVMNITIARFVCLFAMWFTAASCCSAR
jgi:hypothetical protein